MSLDHPALVKSLRKAYSAEKAASLACIGHAGSLKDPAEVSAVKWTRAKLSKCSSTTR